jgi:hypothetical protein
MEEQKPPMPSFLTAANGSCSPDGVSLEFVVKQPSQDLMSDTLYVCSICRGVPRQPVILTRCGHIGCCRCMMDNIKLRSGIVKDCSPCPVCRRIYRREECIPFEKWQLLAQAVFKAIRVRCPSVCPEGKPCEFVGSIMDLTAHERNECPHRVIKCPNHDCDVMAEECKVRKHFPRCPSLAVHCSTCRLPVLWSARDKHCCIRELQKALNGRQCSCIYHSG